MSDPIFIQLGRIAAEHSLDISLNNPDSRRLMVEAFRAGREGRDEQEYAWRPVLRAAWEAGKTTGPLPPAPKIGQKVRVRDGYAVERFPHFKVPPGAEGVVCVIYRSGVWVRFDEPIPGCEEWNNEVNFDVGDPDLTPLESLWDELVPVS